MAERPKIRFENLDGSSDDDDEMVDPLDAEPGESGIHDDDEPDPRANDPFKDEPDDDPEPLKVEADDPEPEETEQEPDPDPAPDYKAELEALRRERDEALRVADAAKRAASEAEKAKHEARAKYVDDEIARAKVALKAAIEDGDSDKQADIQDKLAEMRAEKLFLQRTPAAEGAEPDPDMPRITINGAAAEKWSQGRHWINNPAYKQQNIDLLRVAKAVADDGMDWNQAPYYEEVERRLKLRYPELFPTKTAKRQPGKQTVAPVSRDDPPRKPTNGKSRILTVEDQRNMMRFGLDPRNKEHAKEYLRNKEPEAERART